MNYDDIVYSVVIIFTIIVGRPFRTLKSSKEVFSSSLGVVLCLLVSGFHIIHLFVSILFTIGLLQFCPKSHIHIVSFVGNFLYLLFFRVCHLVSLPLPPPHTNAIQMMLTLKLVGICYEVHDTWLKREKLKKSESIEEKAQLKLELHYEEVNPSPVDVFHYSFTYIGVYTGPYFKFRTYRDMIESSSEKNGPDCDAATLKRIRYVPIFCLLFFLSDYLFPLSFAESKEIFSDYSFMYRVLYMTPVFFTFRMRIYSGFILSECACIMAGLGAYPVNAKSRPGKGPCDFKALKERKDECLKPEDYDFETIHNIDEWGSDFSPTVRGGMKCWNMTVQFWLASNVYKRLKLSKPIKEMLTMLTSAFWHGVHSGYYLSMLTVPFILAVEDFYDRCIRRKLSAKFQNVYDWVSWFIKMQHFSYMGMAFLLLRIDTTIHYWRSIGFIYHGLIVFLHAIAQYINLINAKVEKKLEKSRQTSVVGDYKIKFTRHAKDCQGTSSSSPIGVGDVIDVRNVLNATEGVQSEGKKDK